MAAEDRADCLKQPLERFTDNTITSRPRLRHEVETVRERGYGFTVEELEIGLVAIAAPIRDLDGQVVAALSVSGPPSG